MHTRDDELHMLKDKCRILPQCDKFNSDPSDKTVHFRMFERHEEEVHILSAVKEADKVPKTDWREHLTIPDKYSTYQDKDIDFLTENLKSRR